MCWASSAEHFASEQSRLAVSRSWNRTTNVPRPPKIHYPQHGTVVYWRKCGSFPNGGPQYTLVRIGTPKKVPVILGNPPYSTIIYKEACLSGDIRCPQQPRHDQGLASITATGMPQPWKTAINQKARFRVSRLGIDLEILSGFFI